MNNKLALNFICKDESSVIERMLNSNKNIVDLIVCNDTGSTDGTQDLIKKWGNDNNIPVYVFERPFDNFGSSRNWAMEKLKEVVDELKWDSNHVYGYWIDCDEEIIVNSNFDKSQFVNDIYMINTYIDQMKYTRNTFFRLSKQFRWYGVVHEFIISDDKNITSGLATDIYVKVSMDGNSWKGNIPSKYKSHAFELEKYIDNDRRDPRWIFYTAQSWHDSASTNDREENLERLRRSIKYYKERVERPDGYPEEIFYSQFRIGAIMLKMEEPWNLTVNELLKAYNKDPLRAEPFNVIISYYMMMNEFNYAYIYSKFAYETYHGQLPQNRLLFVDQSLYMWKIAEMHSSICFYTGKKDESKIAFMKVKKALNEMPELFTPDDKSKILSNEKFFL